MDFNNAHRERNLVPERWGLFSMVSMGVHILLFVLLFYWVGRSPDILVLGAEGDNGSNAGGAIEVGIAEARDLGFARPVPISNDGNKKDKINNERRIHEAKPDEVEEVIPQPKQRPDNESKKTDLPVPNKTEKRWTKEVQRAASNDTTASTGTTYGSSKPTIQGGIGINSGQGSGLGTGMPGGSEYGRRLQMILSRNFTPPKLNSAGVTNVVIYVKIARDGSITSVVGGRVPKQFFKQTSGLEPLNFAAERAVILTAAQGVPPFPNNFMLGVNEAVAEVWFQYP